MSFKLDQEHEEIFTKIIYDEIHEKTTKETIKEMLQEYSTTRKSTRTISRQLLNPNYSTKTEDYKKLKIKIVLEEAEENYPKPLGVE